jgi:tripartite-type tricarboxylate transporter receptor subunit TctC
LAERFDRSGEIMAMIRIGAAAIALAVMFSPVAAQAPSPAPSPASSLAGKTVQMIIGFGAGSGFDLWGRLVARHIGKHLPGKPAVVP